MKRASIVISVLSNILLAAVVAFSFLFVSNENFIAVTNEINGCVYAGNTESRKVCLMINVYWGTEYVEPMLDIFEKHDIKTTFFVGGTWVEKNSELIKKIYNAGHEIASHGYSHKEHAKLDYEQNYFEIKKTHDLVKSVLNFDMRLFAPPGGSYNKQTVLAAAELGYKCIMWTRDTIDWRDQNSELIYSRATNNMHGGDLILMHPKEKTVEALPKIIEYAISNNFELTTVSDTIF